MKATLIIFIIAFLSSNISSSVHGRNYGQPIARSMAAEVQPVAKPTMVVEEKDVPVVEQPQVAPAAPIVDAVAALKASIAQSLAQLGATSDAKAQR